MSVTFKDNLLEKVKQAIKEFYHYQKALDDALDHDPKAVVLELGEWNNEHQRKAASVQFFVEEFIAALKKGEFTPDEANVIAEKINGLNKQESLLYEKVDAIRKRLIEEKKRIENGQKALTHYADAAGNGIRTAYLSRDA